MKISWQITVQTMELLPTHVAGAGSHFLFALQKLKTEPIILYPELQL